MSAEIISQSQNDFLQSLDLARKNDVCVADWHQDSLVHATVVYIIRESHTTVAFALLLKCPRDPFDFHSNPWYLSYIYVNEDRRKQGHAHMLLAKIIQDGYQLTAATENNQSWNLFTKLKWICREAHIIGKKGVFQSPL